MTVVRPSAAFTVRSYRSFVVLEDGRLHGLGPGLPGLHVGSQDLVAGFELADGDRGARGE